MRFHFSLLAATMAALALLPASALAADPFTVKTMTFDVKTGPKSDTPCKIVGDLYKPNDASASNPAAAVMATNGFGGSGCKITLDDPDWDGRAGSQLVSFLGGLDYVLKDKPGDPRVGMIGGSYGGQIQFAIAGQDPRLDAIVPQITWNDLSYSLGPNNTDFTKGVTYDTPGVIKLDWPVLFTALGFADPVKNGSLDASHLGPCPNFNDQVCPSLATSGALGYPQPDTLALLRHASVSSYMQRIKIPTFLSQGQSDTLFNLQEAVATYKALRAQGTPVKMLWRSAG